MHARGVATKWQSRRKISLGPVRRACPASGATWNVQVVRGKMTSRCLWHACRALALGLLLMLIGAGMATIGYYAEHISPYSEARSNLTVRVKPDSKGIHLHNLSYAGPIVMGCGGFIIVAACVMTFEARDSAAKVVPARFKLSTTSRGNGTRMNSSRRTNASGMSSTVGSQTRWDNHLGVFRSSPGDNQSKTAALVHFSQVIGSVNQNHSNSNKNRRFSRSGSVPNLATCTRSPTIVKQNSISPTTQRIRHHHRNFKKDRHGGRNIKRSSLNRSIDESGVFFSNTKHSVESQSSMGDVFANKRERNKRSDTAKRHVLARQKQIDSTEVQNGASKVNLSENRSNSDISNLFRKGGKSSNVSRTPSVDSRGVQTDEFLEKAIVTRAAYSKPGALLTQMSTPSVERKFRSQLSICSEPAHIPVHQLSTDQTEVMPTVPNVLNVDKKCTVEMKRANAEKSPQMKRPSTLVLDCNRVETSLCVNIQKQTIEEANSQQRAQKTLFRSNSSSLHKRPSTFVPAVTTSASNKFKLSSELDQIFVISSNRSNNVEEENYDSIQVIDERRMKNMPKSDRARLYKSNTFICEEYYTDKPLTTVETTDPKQINDEQST